MASGNDARGWSSKGGDGATGLGAWRACIAAFFSFHLWGEAAGVPGGTDLGMRCAGQMRGGTRCGK